MFPYEKCKFVLLIHLSILVEQDYLFSSVEAVNGVVWNKNDNDFTEIFNVKSFAKTNKQRILISREIETHNFNGIKLRFTSFPIDSLMNFIMNDTMISGVHGDMWQLIAIMLNFKIQSIKLNNFEYGSPSKNGSWSGLIGYIYRNETDIIPRNVIFPSRLSALEFTLASWNAAYRFYIKKHIQNHSTWMPELFTNELWYSIMGLFLVLTLASFSIHMINFKERKTRDSVSNLRDHFFYIFAIFCNQGWTPQQLEKRSKILILSTRLFAWLLFIAFSSKLISHIAQRKFHEPFNDLESFYKNTDYKLVVQPNSFIYSQFLTPHEPIYKMIKDAGRLIRADIVEAERMICRGNYVWLEIQDVVEAKMSRNCEIMLVGRPYFDTGIAAGLIRGFKYRRAIDLGLLRLQEYGIINRIRSQWLKKTVKITKPRNETLPIKIHHVSLIFVMLCGAMVLSLVVFLIEYTIQFGL